MACTPPYSRGTGCCKCCPPPGCDSITINFTYSKCGNSSSSSSLCYPCASGLSLYVKSITTACTFCTWSNLYGGPMTSVGSNYSRVLFGACWGGPTIVDLQCSSVCYWTGRIVIDTVCVAGYVPATVIDLGGGNYRWTFTSTIITNGGCNPACNGEPVTIVIENFP